MKNIRRIFFLGALLALTGCQKMEATQYGVRFRRLPTFFFGGIASHIVTPGEQTLVFPWDAIYRFDTSVKDISWGKALLASDESGTSHPREDFVHTRARDGNEVALAVTIRYRINPEPTMLRRLVEEVAVDDDGVAAVVAAIGRSDIRTRMNHLSTEKFLDERERYAAVDEVRSSMEARLAPLGIDILRVNLDNFQFERVLPDGSIDTSYQDKLTEIQKLHQDTERERSRIETVKAKKLQELNVAVAKVNRQVAEAQGYKNQSTLRGDGYYQAKTNEAQGILATGQAVAAGLVEQINALSGPGGEAILRLELAKQLQQGDPKFIVMGDGAVGSSVDVRKVDTNELMNQIGMLEGLQHDRKGVAAKPAPKAKDAPARSENKQ